MAVFVAACFPPQSFRHKGPRPKSLVWRAEYPRRGVAHFHGSKKTSMDFLQWASELRKPMGVSYYVPPKAVDREFDRENIYGLFC